MNPDHHYVRNALLGVSAVVLSPVALVAQAPVAFDDTYPLIMNRQKYVELRGFHVNSNGEPLDPDTFEWTIIDMPTNGTLDEFGTTGATYEYIPDEDWEGNDTFTFSFTVGEETSNIAKITLGVDEEWAKPPYGMPEPGFGVLEKAGPTTYSVDLTANTNGFPTCLEAGTVLLLHGSQPPGPPLPPITAMGTPEEPVFIRGASAADKARLTRPLQLEGSTYVIVENLNFDCRYADWDTNGATEGGYHHIWFRVQEKYLDPGWEGSQSVCIRHCSFTNHPTDSQTGGVAAMLLGATHCPEWAPCDPPSANTNGLLVKNCIIYDNLVMDFGDWTTNGQQDYGGAGFEGNSSNMWCLDSVFHHLQGNGVGASRNNALPLQVPAQICYFGRNVIHHTKEYPIALKFVVHSVISQNKLYRGRKSESSQGGAIAFLNNNNVDDWPYSDNVWVIFNEIYDFHRGIMSNEVVHCDTEESVLYDDSRLYVVGNVFHHIGPYDIIAYPETYGFALGVSYQTQARFVNNTVYACQFAVNLGCTHAFDACTNGDEDTDQNVDVYVNNNLILDLAGADAAHARVCSGPWSGDPSLLPTLEEFHHNLHWEDPIFVMATGTYNNDPPYTALFRLQYFTDYGDYSLQEDPVLCDPEGLDFHPTAGSPEEVFTGGSEDEVYEIFDTQIDIGGPFLGGDSIDYDFDKAGFFGDFPIGAFKTENPDCEE